MQIPRSPIRPLLKKLIGRGLAAVDAHAAVARAISRQGEELVIGRRRYDLRRYERVVVVGAGKATASMARAVERKLGPRLQSGFVVVKYGHGLRTKRIVVAEAGHPIPDHEVRIVDNAGREVGERQEGRVEFRGPSATSGKNRSWPLEP